MKWSHEHFIPFINVEMLRSSNCPLILVPSNVMGYSWAADGTRHKSLSFRSITAGVPNYTAARTG